MEAKSIECPGCGKPATGNFCGHCGASLTGATPARSLTPAIVPWVALGFAVVALITALSAKYDQNPGAMPPMSSPMPESAPAALAPAGTPPDLSTMSPREAADRLFNRIMTASENGRTDEAQRFAPMALQAYDRIGPLDNDARYHVALIHLVAGDFQGARAQLAKLRQTAPHHLLAYMLESEIDERSGNTAGLTQVYKGFLAAYDKEMAAARVEYQEHQDNIVRFRAVAQAGTTGKKPVP